MNDLESLTPDLMATTDNLLGETITYIPDGQTTRYPKAHVEYDDELVALGAGEGVQQDIRITVSILALPHMPRSADRIRLGKRPGVTFKPTNPSRDRSGHNWIVKLKVVT